jgi:hypothetical protein
MEEQNNQIENKAANSVAGCLRGILLTCTNIVLSILIALKIGINSGSIVNGVFYGFVFFIIASIIIFVIANKTKHLTVLDCILPLIIGSISAIVFIPISMLGLSVFSSVTCLAASLFLTIVLFMYKAGKVSGGWLIYPFLVFLYEILPIEFPTDIDNILCFGGNITNLTCSLIFGKAMLNKNSEEKLLDNEK